MIQDLHSHTYYSNCGRDDPEKVIKAAIEGGIELLGITDHNYGIGDRKRQYYAEMSALKEKYADKIKILCGVEIATIKNLCITPDEDITFMDYCLIEHIDYPDSCLKKDIFSFAKRCGVPAGIAHTDLFGFIDMIGAEPMEYLKKLADNNIFWEMNVNFDSIHGYREHEYVKRFCEDERQQELVHASGIKVSVGFDGHRVEDYKPERVVEMCRFLAEKNIRSPFDE